MKKFRDKVAVVTGAASGIGLALAEAFAAQGMKIVLADIEEATLQQAAKALEGQGMEVLPVVTDVSKADDLERLAESTLKHFGGVHIVCNNAGVFTAGLSWQAPVADYEWLLGVNVWGVIHGIRTFVPIMLKQDSEGHIVNTSSMAGLTTLPYVGIYHLSKHAVVALSECLYHELSVAESKVKVSVLCPEMIMTNIGSSERNRPSRAPLPASPEHDLVVKSLVEANKKGISPAIIAERVLQAIREERFYILSEEGWRRACNRRLDDIRDGSNPSFEPPVH
jgi:NAD(P)-dependent dehydrogenase (short-subunit alcohol dehydrogenase family)